MFPFMFFLNLSTLSPYTAEEKLNIAIKIKKMEEENCSVVKVGSNQILYNAKCKAVPLIINMLFVKIQPVTR